MRNRLGRICQLIVIHSLDREPGLECHIHTVSKVALRSASNAYKPTAASKCAQTLSDAPTVHRFVLAVLSPRVPVAN